MTELILLSIAFVCGAECLYDYLKPRLLEPCALEAIASLNAPCTGADVYEAMETMEYRTHTLKGVYECLDEMNKRDLISYEARERLNCDGSSRIVRYYRVTAAGRDILNQHIKAVNS